MAKVQYPKADNGARPVRCRECKARGVRYSDGKTNIQHERTCSKYEPNANRQREVFETAIALDKAKRQPAQIDPKKVNSPLAGARTRKAPASPSAESEAAKAAEVVRLRDEDGLSWVQIGAKLGLPGSKSGAATARKLYASTGASYRGTTARQPAKQPRERKPPKPKPETKTAAKLRVRNGDHLIPLDTPDPELYHMLKGRTIKWTINVARLCEGRGGEAVYSEQEATIHPRHFEVDRGEDGTEEPYLNFREVEHTRDGMFATTFRTVRLSQVHEVK
jgi:hypothetical protein